MDVQKHISADQRVFAVYDVTGDWDSMVLAPSKIVRFRRPNQDRFHSERNY